MIKKKFNTLEDFEHFITSERFWVYDKIYQAIEKAYREDKKEADILEVGIEDGTIISIKSSKDEWIESLKLTMLYYQEEEMYEECAHLRDLINEMEKTLKNNG